MRLMQTVRVSKIRELRGVNSIAIVAIERFGGEYHQYLDWSSKFEWSKSNKTGMSGVITLSIRGKIATAEKHENGGAQAH